MQWVTLVNLISTRVLAKVKGQSKVEAGLLNAIGEIYNVQQSPSVSFIKLWSSLSSQHPAFLWWWYSDWRLRWLTPHRVAVCWDGEWFRTSATNKTWVLRLHFPRTVHPHPLTLSPYVQMLARGITGPLGWIRRPLRGRESRGGHGRGWPATQLPAQVSTGWHEQLFQPPPAHSLHAEGGPPQLKSSSERICGQNGIC